MYDTEYISSIVAHHTPLCSYRCSLHFEIERVRPQCWKLDVMGRIILASHATLICQLLRCWTSVLVNSNYTPDDRASCKTFINVWVLTRLCPFNMWRIKLDDFTVPWVPAMHYRENQHIIGCHISPEILLYDANLSLKLRFAKDEFDEVIRVCLESWR